MTPPTEDQQDFEALLEYLRQHRCFDFTGYKRPSLRRRIGRRLQALGIEHFSDYIDYLEVHPEEFATLFNTILINVTRFFRDPGAWESLRETILPQILAQKAPDEPIRVWSAGCASGEEAYTLAMILAEALGIEQMRQRVKIFATDIDEEALNQARQTSYSAPAVENVPQELLSKYFEPVNSHFVFNQELRRTVIFGRHDLVQDAPISRIDLLVCRNTLMYFNADTQSRILDRFHFSLNNKSGFLFLGQAEMLFSRPHLFTPVNLRQRIFVKVPRIELRDRLLMPAPPESEEPRQDQGNPAQIWEAILNVDPTPQIVIDQWACLILANERARQLFGLTSRDIGQPLKTLPIYYRPVELRSSVEEVRQTLQPLKIQEVEWTTSEGKVDLEVQLFPLVLEEGQLLGIKIFFADVSHFKQLQRDLQHSRQELQSTNEELETTNEELQSTNEELQSTNEELETMNEELQSTNEELETMNEELQAMNDELRDRGYELNQTNAFLNSILSSLNVGVAVVDLEMHLLAWNPQAEDLWGLRTEEVLGSHLLNLDIGLPVEQLRQPIRTCLNQEIGSQEVTLPATNRRGRDIECKITCTPLFGTNQAIHGTILLMEVL